MTTKQIAGFDVTHTVEALVQAKRAGKLLEAPATFYRLHEEGAADAIVLAYGGHYTGHYEVATTDWHVQGPGIALTVAVALGVEFISDARPWEKKYGI